MNSIRDAFVIEKTDSSHFDVSVEVDSLQKPWSLCLQINIINQVFSAPSLWKTSFSKFQK